MEAKVRRGGGAAGACAVKGVPLRLAVKGASLVLAVKGAPLVLAVEGVPPGLRVGREGRYLLGCGREGRYPGVGAVEGIAVGG